MAAPIEVFVPIIYKVKDPCSNPIMIEWINSLGGIDRWLFERKQDVIINYAAGDIYEEYFFDTETTNRTIRKRKSDYTHGWTLYTEDLTRNEFEAISEIKSTPSLYAIKNDESRLGVISTSLTGSYNRYAQKHTLTLQINFPRNFDPERWLATS